MKAQSIDTPGVIDRVLQLFHDDTYVFHDHRELILGFNNNFLVRALRPHVAPH